MYILGCLRGDSVQKVISCGKLPHWTKWPRGLDFSHSKLHWFQPLQLKKRKRNEHFRASWKGLMVKKSFRSFQKRQFEKRIFNQYYEYHKFVENQLNFKPILETKSAPFRTVRINRTTILGNQSTWDKSRVMHHRHFNRLFSAKKGSIRRATNQKWDNFFFRAKPA